MDADSGWVDVEGRAPSGPTAAKLLGAALPPSFEIGGVSHPAASSPKLGATSWTVQGAEVTARCVATPARASPGAQAAGIGC